MRIEGVERGRVTMNINGGCCMVNLTTPSSRLGEKDEGVGVSASLQFSTAWRIGGREKDDPRNFVKSFSSLLFPPPLIILFSPVSFDSYLDGILKNPLD